MVFTLLCIDDCYVGLSVDVIDGVIVTFILIDLTNLANLTDLQIER